jgi:hypothetical protein
VSRDEQRQRRHSPGDAAQDHGGAQRARLPRPVDRVHAPQIAGGADGNLGAHLETLEKAGYIVVEKRFEDRKPQTRVRMSPAGRRAFVEHVAYLREIIDDAGA